MKTIEDFRKLFYRTIAEGNIIAEEKGARDASIYSATKIAEAILNEYSHIAEECDELIKNETRNMMAEREKERESVIEEIVDKMLNELMNDLPPCNDPICDVCVAEKERSEESEQAKTDSLKLLMLKETGAFTNERPFWV